MLARIDGQILFEVREHKGYCVCFMSNFHTLCELEIYFGNGNDLTSLLEALNGAGISIQPTDREHSVLREFKKDPDNTGVYLESVLSENETLHARLLAIVTKSNYGVTLSQESYEIVSLRQELVKEISNGVHSIVRERLRDLALSLPLDAGLERHSYEALLPSILQDVNNPRVNLTSIAANLSGVSGIYTQVFTRRALAGFS